MEHTKKRIAVLFGGCSSEYEVSLQSAYAVIGQIDRERYEVYTVGISREGSWYLYEGETERIPEDRWQREEACYPAALCMERRKHAFVVWKDMEPDKGPGTTIAVDAALPILHGKNGEDGTVQGALKLAGIPVIGCGTLASALCMDKERAHRMAEAWGIRVPKSFTLSRGVQGSDIGREYVPGEGKAESAESLAAVLGYPLFVKPLRAGSSFGITKVSAPEELPKALERAFSYDDTVVFEELIPGFEVGCAILEEAPLSKEDMSCGEVARRGGNCLPQRRLLVGEVDEIELSEGFFDYEEKYHLKTSKIHVPARIDREKAEEIKETAKRIYRCLGCSGFARVDMFLMPEGEIYFNEVNTIPGFTEHSRFPGMMKAAGLTFAEVVERLCGLIPENMVGGERGTADLTAETGKENRGKNLVLVNAAHALEEEPDAGELEAVHKENPAVFLKREAAEQLKCLLDAVDREGEIVLVSGYRSREEQEKIFADSLRENGRSFTETYVAPPDHSEHQTGLAIDLGKRQESIDFIRPEFPRDGVFLAFREKAPEYGFVERYPAGKEQVTGIGAEPWHFRYVGCPHARIMTERHLVLEEYLDYLWGQSDESI